jgi:DNA repair exonuclease SbcCD ATPase subunit
VEEHKINIKARETRAHEIAEQMRLAQGSDVDETHENINQAVREHEGALRELKEKHRHDLDLQRRKLSDARNDLSQSEEKLKNLRVTEQRDREQLQQLTKGLQRGDYMTGDQLERDKLALKDAEESQKKYRQETEQLKNEIRRKAKDEASIKAKKEDLDEELSNMVSQQDAITKLHTLRDQTNSKQAQVDEAFDKIEAEVHGHSDGRRIGSSADDVEQVRRTEVSWSVTTSMIHLA